MMAHATRSISSPSRRAWDPPRHRPVRTLIAAALTLVALIALPGCDTAPVEPPAESAPEPPAAGAATGDAPRPVARSADERPRIVAFGDSLTSGLGVAPADTYPARLQRRLDEAGLAFRVINAGVSGETSAGGLRRVEWVLKSRPSLVILELGGNDGLRAIDPDQTRANLEAIITKFREAGVPVVLAGMKLPPNYGRAFTRKFEAIYPDLAATYDLPFMPFFLEDVATREGLTQADGIHPTGEGYRVIVDNLLPVLEPVLADLDAAAETRPAAS